MTFTTMAYALFLIVCTLLFQGDVYSASRFTSEVWNSALMSLVNAVTWIATVGEAK